MMDHDAFLKEAINTHDVKGVLHLGAMSPCNQLALYVENKIPQIILVEGNPDHIKTFPLYHPYLPDGCQLLEGVISDIDDKETPFRIIYSKDLVNKGCASLFKLSPKAQVAPKFFEKEVLQLKTVTVDTLLQRNNIDPSTINLLAMDIQGAELLALRGATKLLPHLDVITTEVTWGTLYEEQAKIHEIDEFLNQHGFVRKKTMKCHPAWGEALYERK